MSEFASAVNSQPQSLKRYKSVRQAQKQVGQAAPPVPEPSQQLQQQNAGLQRSMSRYKGRATAAAGSALHQPQKQPFMPQIPSAYTQGQPSYGDDTQAQVANGARNFSCPKRDTSAPAGPPLTQRPSARLRATTETGTRPQSNFQTAQYGQIQSPPRMSRQATVGSHNGTYVTNPVAAFNPTMQGQMYTVPQAQVVSPEDKWTNTSDLTGLQNEHNRKIKERQRKEKEAKIRVLEELKRKEEEEQQRQEAEERQRQEDALRKAEEQRLVQQKVKEAKKQAAERKKSTRQSPKRLFSRSSEDRPNMPTRGSSDVQSFGSSGRHEVPAPAPPAFDLPVKQVDAAVVARPYQPAPNIRKESISQPLSQSSSMSPPATRFSADAPVPTKPTFFDAPKSAINAGEHSVIVTCRDSNTILTVNNDTTVESLLRTAAAEMAHEKINAETAIMLESFAPQGVERRLRRYEHVRDILNSWDSDRQNKLMIVPSVTMGKDEDDLFASYVPRREPTETVSVRMHHSSRPGHWDKRVITLRPGGQVSVAKDDGGKDERVVCTLSDFDIYIPTPRQVKRIKAPKKICFAIKSQGRPAMFITGENFVHWFATKDRQIADQFYVAVQAWRSWYLVEKMGMGRGKKVEPEVHAGLLGNVGGIGEMAAANKVTKAPADSGIGGLSLEDDIFKSLSRNQKAKDEGNILSKESLGYDLGGLINRIGDNDFTPSAQSNSLARSSTQKKSSYNGRGGPPSSYPTTLMARLEVNEEPTFAPSGLLGRTYSQKQKAIAEGGGRSSLDPGREEMDWGKPLVDLTNKPQGTNVHHGKKVSLTTGDGPLIGRAGNYNE